MITNIESTSLNTQVAATVQVTTMGNPGPQGPQGVPGGGGITDAPLTGGPYGRQAGAWIEAVGPAGPPGSLDDGAIIDGGNF